jgi:hypothetical protein
MPEPGRAIQIFMSPPDTLDLKLAAVCLRCPACRRARKRQRGILFQLVRRVESRFCPFCKAYERVHGRKAHAPVSLS